MLISWRYFILSKISCSASFQFLFLRSFAFFINSQCFGNIFLPSLTALSYLEINLLFNNHMPATVPKRHDLEKDIPAVFPSPLRNERIVERATPLSKKITSFKSFFVILILRSLKIFFPYSTFEFLEIHQK